MNEGIPTTDGMAQPVIVRAHHGAEPAWGQGSALRDASNPFHLAEDLELLRQGIIDHTSFISGYQPHKDPVRIVVRDKQGNLKHIRHSHNLRTNAGGKWQTLAMGGGPAAALHAQFTASARSTSSPWTVTSTLTTADTTSWAGHQLVMGNTYGSIISHTSGANAVYTIDQWYDTTSATGAVASTPAAGQAVITAGQMPARWIALTNDTTQTIDTAQTSLTAEITTNGLARAFGVYTPTYPSTTAGTTNQGTYTVSYTFTATGTQACQRAALMVAQNGGPMGFLASFTQATLASGDTVQLTWTIND